MALVAEYGFNEGSGSTAADSSGNNRTLTSGTGWTTTAKNGAGAGGTFNATLGVGPSGAAGSFTIMCWAKLALPANGDYVGIANSPTACPNGFWFEASGSGGNLIFDSYVGNNVLSSSTPVAPGTAVHIALVCNNYNYTIYQNSISAGTLNGGQGQDLSKTDWMIGGGNGDVSISSGEWIDELRFFDTALTTGEITTWAATPIGSADMTPLGWII